MSLTGTSLPTSYITAPTAPASSFGTVSGGSSMIPQIAMAGAGAVSSIFGGKNSNKAATQAAQMQADAANRAALLQSQAAAEALQFAKQQEANRQNEWASSQKQNYDIWLKENAYTKEMDAYNRARAEELEAAKRGRLKPFLQSGAGALGQLARPIPSNGAVGGQSSLASIFGAR